MKKKIVSILLALVMVTAFFSTTAFAGGGGIIFKFIYVDADIADLENSGLEGFEPDSIQGIFVMNGPEGDVSITDYGPTWNKKEGFIANNCYWQTSVMPADMGLKPGTYTLESCPVPEGYEIEKITGKGSFTQQQVDEDYFDVFNFYIRLRKAGEPAPAPEPDPDPEQQTLVAMPTSAKVLVNGTSIAFDAYNINGNNYFKLRDLAYALNESEKQFNVGWDGENNAISLISGEAYTAVGGEMTGKGEGNKTPIATTSKIYLDGEDVSFTAYNIEGNNYFKLRDVGQAFDFGVDWDGANNTIVIDTSKGYTPE